MRYLSLLFLLLSFGTVAQDDITHPRYREIYRQTQQRLTELGYRVGRAGNAAYRPDQFVVLRLGSSAGQDAANDRQLLQTEFGNRYSSQGQCGCQGAFQLDLIEVDSLGGEERGRSGSDRVAETLGHEEVAPNYYITPELLQVAPHPAYNQLPPNFSVRTSGKPAAPVDIAILDTGLDLRYQDSARTGGLAPLYLWENPAEIGGGPDPFCYPGDLVGWDFVNDDAAPVDDHSHGTHVASRIAGQLAANAPDVNYRFMSLKMLDQNGVGSTFTATCAVLYAAYHRADVINASWGFYGESDPVLRRAFRYAQDRGVVTVASAGNERVDLAELLHYPGNYALDAQPLTSVLFVAASVSGTSLWPDTNYRTVGAANGGFIAAPGFDRNGLVPMQLPGGNVASKTGTSIAAPYATALAAHGRHLAPGSAPSTVRNRILTAVRAQGAADQITVDGATYPFYTFEWVDLR